MTRVMVLCLVVSSVLVGSAQNAAPPVQTPSGRGAGAAAPVGPQEILLWEHGAPGALGQADTDKPTITAYLAPRGSSGTAVIVAPGGGYQNLAMEHEGRQEAYGSTPWGFGVRAQVPARPPLSSPGGARRRAARDSDGAQSRAQEFNVIPDRIGMMGFSAGGHLTSTAGTHFDAGKADADRSDRTGQQPAGLPRSSATP